jgi:two-component system sensor histidine kinase QseC
MTPAPERSYSLRRRLLWLILGGSTALWLASICIMAAIAWRETNDVFDDALKESGYLVMAATTDWNERGLPIQTLAPRESRKVEMHCQIVVDGKVVQRTSGAPPQPFVDSLQRSAGFADIQLGAKRWRVFFARSGDKRFAVEVGQEYRRRLDILVELAEHLAPPMLAMLALLAAASWFAIGRIIKPIAGTAAAITGKSRDDLSLLGTENQPAELLPIVEALNGMLGRLDAALQAERRFTADAAHELRTPLAGVHMHVQLMQRQHPHLARSFSKLRTDIERSTTLVDSLLTLARLDPIARADLARGRTMLQPMLEELVRAHSHGAGQLGISLRLRCMVDHVSVNADMLRIVLRNLVDNALRYCGPGCVVEISACWNGGAARLAVRDNGPGVSEADRTRLTERFFRVLGSGQGGNGLGLSIVRRIVELHGAALSFGVGLEQRGLAALIDFPACSGSVHGALAASPPQC